MSHDPEAEFRPARGGRFMEPYGPAEGKPYSQKKVCLVATDRAFLVRSLYELSRRDDCYYVKYANSARDGMYLGRCFLESDAAAGQLCQELKAHPQVLATLQDDEFFDAFRTP